MSQISPLLRYSKVQISIILFGFSIYLTTIFYALNLPYAQTRSLVFFSSGYFAIILISFLGIWKLIDFNKPPSNNNTLSTQGSIKGLNIWSIWLHPPVIMSLWLILGIMLPGLISFFTEIKYDYHRRVLLLPEAQLIGSLIIVLGFLFLWVGYLGGINWSKKITPHTNINGTVQPWLLAIVFLIAISAHLFQISVTGIEFGADTTALGELQGFAQWLNLIQNLELLVLAIVSLKCFQGEWPKTILIFVTTILLGFGFLSGFMKPIIRIGLVIMLTLHHSKAVSKRKQIVLLTVFIILGILIVPIAQGLRDQFGSYDPTDLTSVLNFAISSFQHSWGEGFNSGISIFFEKIDARQTALAHIPAWVAANTPKHIPFLGWKKFATIPFYFIPRAVWSNKPILALGRWFNIIYLGAPKNTETAIAFMAFGEGYIYTGWIGVCIVGLLFGILLALLYKKSVSMGTPVLLLAIFPVFYDLEAQFTLVVLSSVQVFIIYYLVYRGLTFFAFSKKILPVTIANN